MLEGGRGGFQLTASIRTLCRDTQRWEIKATRRSYVEFNITSFDVGQWSCLNDTFLVIRDGLNSSDSILASLCYKQEKFPITVRSSGNALSVEAVNKWKGLSFKALYQTFSLNQGGKKHIFYWVFIIISSYRSVRLQGPYESLFKET